MRLFMSFQIAPPQKDPKQKKLSENVRKLMESKASEQVAKEREAEDKRKKLLQLRSEDKKSLRYCYTTIHCKYNSCRVRRLAWRALKTHFQIGVGYSGQ